MIQVMGILNSTPDSFSDGGQFHKTDDAVRHAEQMLLEGADILDVGGESTRPGAASVSVDEELERVIPVIDRLKQNIDCVVSVDTSKPEVMAEAIRAGVDMVNDVRALQEGDALAVCAAADVDICLMHMQGMPRSMQSNPQYDDVIADVADFLQQRIRACEAAGIKRDRLIIDPGFGFGKTVEHNLRLLAGLDSFTVFDLPILVGLSRKSTIGALLNDAPVGERLYGSLAAAVMAADRGAGIIRTHDVKSTKDALMIFQGVAQYE